MKTVIRAVRTRIAGLRPPRERYSRLRDALLWIVLVTPVLAQAGVRAVAGSPWWPLVTGAVALAVTVRISRTLPVPALIASVALVLIDPSFAWAPPVMSYLVGRRTPGYRLPALGFAGILVAGSVLVALGVVGWVYAVVGFAFLGITPWLLGRYRRQHVALVHAGWERAEHLERERRIVSEQARLRERARISRDMHDSLGHELSLIALQAGGLELAEGLDESQRAAAGELRERAGAATERLREIIGVLREDAGTAPTDPASLEVADLVERARNAGMVVALHVEGATGGTPLMVDRAAFRVVQEALTNVAKHAPAAETTVRMRHADERTVVSIVNDLPGDRSDRGRSERVSGSQGIVGLRERARLLGGVVTARERSTTFEVVADLPHGHPPTSTGGDSTTGSRESESALQRARARHEVRRSLIVAVAGAGLMAAALMAVQVAVWMREADRAHLPPERFARIEVGQAREGVDELLPPEQISRSSLRPARLPPREAECEHYGSENGIFGTGPVYRLCFDGGRLVSKDVLEPTGSDA